MNENIYESSRKIISYDDMMKLIPTSSNFDYVDECTNGINTRTFIYRMESFSLDMFLKDGARNMRGIVFNKDSKEILALPFFKFFNIYENPYFTDFDEVNKWKIKNIYEKIDQIIARTKGGSTNRESKIAMNITINNRHLYKFIKDLVNNNYTPMFELISPINALNIVEYEFIDLVFLGARNIHTGELLMNNGDLLSNTQKRHITAMYPYMDDYKFKNIQNIVDECLYSEKERNNILEGYVVEFDNGELVKFKYGQYLKLHKELDNYTGEMDIVDMIFNNKIDDFYISFNNKTSIINNINMIKKSIEDTWTNNLNSAKEFYNENKELNKKDFFDLLNKDCKNNKVKFGAALIYYDSKGHPNDHAFNKILVSYRANRSWRESQYYTN